MKKKWENETYCLKRSVTKILRFMKLTLMFILFASVQLFATVYSQTTRLSINMRNATLADLFEKIEEKSEFRFLYNNNLIEKKNLSDMRFDGRTVMEILDQVLEGSGSTYSILENNLIVIKPAEGQQGATVKGKVTNGAGEPLPGVSVAIKGTTQGTITDADGLYTLTNVPGKSVLHFSFVGMKAVDVDVSGRTSIDVVMEEETIGLDEVVAIGYGTVKKQDLTGSVASVSGANLSERKTQRVASALQGTMPGVTVTRSGGGPGEDATIRIRGITTIGNADPLYIIDGIPGSLSILNPNEIESISVLKDAASASIYGSKAAAGVILVTTKRAKTGKVDLNYEFETGIDQPTRLPKWATAVPYMKMVNELWWNDAGNIGTEYGKYAKDLIDNYPSLHKENPDKYPDVRHADYLNDYAPRQSHRLSFGAGEKNLKSQVSLSYDKINALIDRRAWERINARSNNDLTISKMVAAHFDLHIYHAYDQRNQGTQPSAALLRYEPVETPFWSDGRAARTRNNEQPWGIIFRGGTTKARSTQISGRAAIDFSPLKGLKISGIVAPGFNFYQQKVHQVPVPTTDLGDPNTITGYVSAISNIKLTENRNESRSMTTQILADYVKSFGNHNLTALAGFENYYTITENLMASRDNYTLANYPYLSIGPLDLRDNSGSASEYASRSYFGRIMYNYKNRYLFQSNLRYDGSSRFAADYRWGFFPSFSAGWVISDEAFMKNVPVLSYLKLRASWGSLGNERIGNYPYQSTVSFGSSLFYSAETTTVLSKQTAYIGKYAIKDISWETTESFDIGIDAFFFDNKMQIVADYYNKTTRDMLLALEIPDYIGLENPDQNTGKMSTKGWEFEIRYNNKIGDLNYSVSGNISDFKSVMGDLGGTEFLGSQVKFEGSEFNEWYGYISEGLYQTADEVANSAKINNRVSPGDIKYKDISGPNGVPDGIINSTYDRTLLGGSLPRYEYGGNIRLDYKNIDFSLVFQGVGKINSYMTSIMARPLQGGVYGVPADVIGNYWSKYNTEQRNKEVFYPRLSEVSAGGQSEASGNNYVTSDYWLFNGRYFRLKNIILGYSLPKSVVQKLTLNNVRIYANLSDLFSIDKWKGGYDPESGSSGYFIQKSYLFGISVKF